MRPLHFLVTDEDVDKRLLIGIALTRACPTASVFECYSGQEALDYFAANRVDVLVTDHTMHPVNGIELVTRVRGAGSSIPIIMVSGHPDIKLQAEAAGVDLFLDADRLNEIGKPVAAFLRQRGLLP